MPFWIASPVLVTSLPKPWAVLQPVLTNNRRAVANNRTTMRLNDLVMICLG